MKHFIIALAIASSLQVVHASDVDSDFYDLAHDHLISQGLDCNNLVHIEKGNFGSIIIYDITCETDRGHNIYQYAPSQLVTTHYIFDK